MVALNDKVNVLLVDDQPAKLLSYEAVLADLGENLIKVSSAQEALACLLRTDVAVILVDVCMPDLNGFELVSMIVGQALPPNSRLVVSLFGSQPISSTFLPCWAIM